MPLSEAERREFEAIEYELFLTSPGVFRRVDPDRWRRSISSHWLAAIFVVGSIAMLVAGRVAGFSWSAIVLVIGIFVVGAVGYVALRPDTVG